MIIILIDMDHNHIIFDFGVNLDHLGSFVIDYVDLES